MTPNVARACHARALIFHTRASETGVVWDGGAVGERGLSCRTRRSVVPDPVAMQLRRFLRVMFDDLLCGVAINLAIFTNALKK
jgi:hypothetical protein